MPASRPSLRFALLVGLGLATVAAVRPAVPPGPAPSLRQEPSSGAAAERNAACMSCHVEQAQEWRASRHAVAASNPAFVEALAREPAARHDFCLDCHAPERRPHGAMPGGRDLSAEALGVACVTCHVPLGAVLATPGARGGPHGVLRADWMAGAEACAGCHQFDEPGGNWPLQNTVVEAAELSDTACQQCHMRAPGAGHRFPGAYDARLVARSVKVEVSRAHGVLTLMLEPTPPHAVPTGDLFRRLRLTIRIDGEAPTHRYFGRRFRRRFDGVVDRLEPVADTRLHMARKDITMPVGAATTRWELVLERVASAPSTDPADDVVEGATPVASGCIDPRGAACDP